MKFLKNNNLKRINKSLFFEKNKKVIYIALINKY